MTPERIMDTEGLLKRTCILCGRVLRDHTEDDLRACLDRVDRMFKPPVKTDNWPFTDPDFDDLGDDAQDILSDLRERSRDVDSIEAEDPWKKSDVDAGDTGFAPTGRASNPDGDGEGETAGKRPLVAPSVDASTAPPMLTCEVEGCDRYASGWYFPVDKSRPRRRCANHFETDDDVRTENGPSRGVDQAGTASNETLREGDDSPGVVHGVDAPGPLSARDPDSCGATFEHGPHSWKAGGTDMNCPGVSMEPSVCEGPCGEPRPATQMKGGGLYCDECAEGVEPISASHRWCNTHKAWHPKGGECIEMAQSDYPPPVPNITEMAASLHPAPHDHWDDSGWGKKGYTHAHFGGDKPHNHHFDPPTEAVPTASGDAFEVRDQRSYELGYARGRADSASPRQEDDPRCKHTFPLPGWAGEDQMTPCRCDLPNGHDGPHMCDHLRKPSADSNSGDGS